MSLVKKYMKKNVSKKKKRNDWLTRKKWVFGKTSLHANTKEEKPAVLIGHPPLTYDTTEKCKYVGPLPVRCPGT